LHLLGSTRILEVIKSLGGKFEAKERLNLNIDTEVHKEKKAHMKEVLLPS